VAAREGRCAPSCCFTSPARPFICSERTGNLAFMLVRVLADGQCPRPETWSPCPESWHGRTLGHKSGVDAGRAAGALFPGRGKYSARPRRCPRRRRPGGSRRVTPRCSRLRRDGRRIEPLPARPYLSARAARHGRPVASRTGRWCSDARGRAPPPVRRSTTGPRPASRTTGTRRRCTDPSRRPRSRRSRRSPADVTAAAPVGGKEPRHHASLFPPSGRREVHQGTRR
jgi:hypothetical protein